MSRFNEIRYGPLDVLASHVDYRPLDEGEVRAALLNLIEKIRSRDVLWDRLNAAVGRLESRIDRLAVFTGDEVAALRRQVPDDR
jgi:hypothetical protein